MLLNIDKNEKRAKFDALPSPEISSVEVRNIPTVGGGYAGRLVDWLQSKGVIGNGYKNEDTGMENITINPRSVRNVAHHGAGAGKIALLEVVPNLIKNGVHLETNPKNERGLISHIFAAQATIDGVPYAVSYVVREDVNSRRYYDHSLIKIEVLDQIDGQAPYNFTDRSATGSRHHVSRPSTIPAGEESTVKILKKHLGVNTQNQNS